MTAGIPGAGIGGLFYLINALLLPLRGLWRRARGEAVPWSGLLRQAALAAGIVAGIWVAGWLLGLWLGPGRGGVSSPLGAAAAARTARLLGAATLVASFATLAVVLLSVQLARLVVRRPR